MKIIIAGSRDFENWDAFMGFMSVLPQEFEITEVVSGGAIGPDTMAIHFADLFNYPIKVFPADWDTHGKKAGILRNIDMANYADRCIAFWNGTSRGTAHMIDSMYKRNKLVMIYKV